MTRALGPRYYFMAVPAKGMGHYRCGSSASEPLDGDPSP